MISTLVKQSNEFPRGLKTITVEPLKHTFENDNQNVLEKDLKVIGSGFWGNNKAEVAEALPIREIKLILNIQDQSVPLHLKPWY